MSQLLKYINADISKSKHREKQASDRRAETIHINRRKILNYFIVRDEQRVQSILPPKYTILEYGLF